ncbi:MAG: tRNA isopentenyl-2-thiomethyl-A-37 hydroxylase MiaE [Pseudomonadota bacterium]|nr:tRNA isopentenyl-2-thiomethyl-A-37 hydroxylase MiaE [Pseudomonadota bacterium]
MPDTAALFNTQASEDRVDLLIFNHLSPTPSDWAKQALSALPILLNDHAACEKKAALFAMSLTPHLIKHPTAIAESVKIAKEELRHYELVLGWLQRKNWPLKLLSPSRYAQGLQSLNLGVPTLLQRLLVAAIIEARSCERFKTLVPYLKHNHPDLAAFYYRLYRAERRHALVYVDWAEKLYPTLDLALALSQLLRRDQQLMNTQDKHLRFHSGIKVSS